MDGYSVQYRVVPHYMLKHELFIRFLPNLVFYSILFLHTEWQKFFFYDFCLFSFIFSCFFLYFFICVCPKTKVFIFIKLWSSSSIHCGSMNKNSFRVIWRIYFFVCTFEPISCCYNRRKKNELQFVRAVYTMRFHENAPPTLKFNKESFRLNGHVFRTFFHFEVNR